MQRKFIDPKEYDSLQLEDLVSEVNYGLLKIDAKQKVITSEIKNIDGETIRKKIIGF